jgi:3-keto-disaccharide hydrolase
MEAPTSAPAESNDRKEIIIIAVAGVVIILCICSLLAVAGYFFYTDLKSRPTIQPEPTPKTLVKTPVPPQGKLLFEETFDTNDNQWAEGTFNDEYGKTDFTINGKYVWAVTAAKGVNQKSWADKAPSVQDFIVSVDATHTAGTQNASYGILFRITDADNLYYFAISDVGDYYLGSLTNGEWSTLIDWTETPYIHPNATNTLKVKSIGDELTLYINDNAVDRIQDSAHAEGTSGIAIELYDAGDKSNFEFDNFSMTAP